MLLYALQNNDDHRIDINILSKTMDGIVEAYTKELQKLYVNSTINLERVFEYDTHCVNAKFIIGDDISEMSFTIIEFNLQDS